MAPNVPAPLMYMSGVLLSPYVSARLKNMMEFHYQN